MRTLTTLDTPVLDEPFINAADGKTYVAVKGVDNTCIGCTFYTGLHSRGCRATPDCISIYAVYKEYRG